MKDTLSVLLYEEENGRFSGKRWVVKPMEVVLEEVKEGEEVEPTFEISRWQSENFLRSMAEMAEELGVKTNRQATEEVRNIGVLAATRDHLEDMRLLVFKTKPKDEVQPT